MKRKSKFDCKFCGLSTKVQQLPAYSAKFKAYFCDQSCYENYRMKLDKNWKDKPIKINLNSEQG